MLHFTNRFTIQKQHKCHQWVPHTYILVSRTPGIERKPTRVSWNLSKTQALNSHLFFCCNKTAWQNYRLSKMKSKHLWKNTLQIIKYNLQSFIRVLLKKNKKCKCWVLLFSKGKQKQPFYQATVALDTVERQRDIPLALRSFTPGQTRGE